ncbi:CAPN15 [Symbiodinium sp. CCMP2456]|nr:CAPN15 [Symbiodinium sp. CCMP2456]
MWHLLLLGLACGSAQPINEVGLSLAKAGAESQVQAQAAVAQMTGQLLLKQQQYEAAKLKMEQLSRQEESYSRRADMMAKRESRMEELAKVHGGVLEKAFRAKARTQEFQKKMLQGEEEVKKLNQEIKAQKQLLKTTEDQLIAIRHREEDYNNGARLAVMKSNKLERDLKDARKELASQKQNLSDVSESAQVQEARWDSARRTREHQEVANLAEERLVESKQGQLGLLRQVNPQEMSLAEQELERTKLLLKEARRKNKEEAKVEEEALRQEQEAAKATHDAAEVKLHKVQTQLEHTREEQKAAVQAARDRAQRHIVDDEEERTKEAEKALKPYQLKLQEAEGRLHQQEVQNQVQSQEMTKKTAALQTEAKQNASNLQRQEHGSLKVIDHMKADVTERLQEDQTKQSNMQRAIEAMKESQRQQTRKATQLDSQLRQEQAKLEEASLRLQTMEKKQAQEQLAYETRMYEMNVQKEEKAQQEVDRLQQEFHKVHNDKNEKVTALSHKLQVMLNCTDFAQGFVRSVTARHPEDVEKLRQKLLDLKARAKHDMTYQAVKEELQRLRLEFARHQGGGLANLTRKAEPIGQEKPAARAMARIWFLASPLLFLPASAKPQWSAQVMQACGLSSPDAEVISLDGSISLNAPKLCGANNWPCRSRIHAAVGALNDDALKVALREDLYRCALPVDRSSKLVMLAFTVQGLDQQKWSQWGDWMRSAFTASNDLEGFTPKSSTWFPVQAGVEFLVSGTGNVPDTAAAQQSLAKGLQESARRSSFAGLFTPHISISAMSISDVQSSSFLSIGMSNFMILFRFGTAFLALGVLYGIIAACAYFSGAKWLQPYVLCWPEVCDGRGCIFYRIFCCPCVMIYNAIRIYCCACCHSYVSFLCMPSCTKGCCWDDFEDADFPASDQSLGQLQGDTAAGVLHQGGQTDWRKASEIAGKDSHEARGAELFEGSIDAADLLQGALGDCWLIAALACVAERPEILQQAFLTQSFDPRGKYKIRLWDQVQSRKGTQWVVVVIDELIPCHAGTLKPRFAQANSNEMWALLMEKAFAKLYGGYNKLEGGQMSWALSAITGNPAVHFMRDHRASTWGAWNPNGDGTLSKDDDEFTDDEFFRFLLRLKRNGAFLCCAGIGQANRQGLIDSHAYSVLQLATVQPDMSGNYFRMVQIRNPHGQGEWRGAWSDNDRLWSQYPSVKRQLLGSDEPKDDGSFWMQWEDFVNFWKGVQVVDCETNIRTVAIPIYDEGTVCGPILAALWGCLEYWFCCVGLKRLYLGRAGSKTVEEMKKDMNSQCGYDQQGFYCHYCEKKAVAEDSISDDEESGILR